MKKNKIVIIFVTILIILAIIFLVFLGYSYFKNQKINRDIELFIGEYELITNNYDKYEMNILAKEKILITHDNITHYKKDMISLATFNIIGKNKILVYFNGVAENIEEDKIDEFSFKKICFKLKDDSLKQIKCPNDVNGQYIDTDDKNFNIKYKKNN